MKISSSLWLGAGLATMVAGTASAQQAPAATVLTTHPLRGGAYWVSGGRANTGFIVGDKGVVVIDAQTSPDDGRKALAEIARVTPKPVDTIVLTHGDPDHVLGLPAYPDGMAIIAHENTRATMLVSNADPTAPPPYKPLYKVLVSKYLPTHTLHESETTTIDGVPMRIIYVAPAHTNSDIFVYLPQQRIVYGGDILTNQGDPFPVIHIGGSSAGWIEAMKTILSLNADLFVCGHGPMLTRAQLTERLHAVEERRARIEAMVYAGKSADEVEQALPEPGANAMFPDFNRTVYGEISKGFPPSVPPWDNLTHR